MNEYGQHEGAVAAIFGMFMTFFLFFALLATFIIICRWKIYSKAGKPGWAAIIPIYNFIILLEIVGKPAWWVALLFVPGANLVIAILVAVELSKSFGQSGGFAVGLIFLPIVFYPLLAFGNYQYVGPGGVSQVASPSV
jgi:hypothetical protein